MNLYDKVRNAECEIPESFDMGAGQLIDFAQHSQDRYDLACIAFKFGYMQGCRNAEQTKRAESERKVKRSGYGVISARWPARSGARDA